MAADFHNPISRAIQPEEMAETLSKFRSSQERGKEEYAAMINTFYDLITDFYEYGWGQSFHFAPGVRGASFEEALAAHQYFLGEGVGLKPGMKVLDVGCGVGGPPALARREVRRFDRRPQHQRVSGREVRRVQQRSRPGESVQRFARRFHEHSGGRGELRRGLPCRGPGSCAGQDGRLCRDIPGIAAGGCLRRLRLVRDSCV